MNLVTWWVSIGVMRAHEFFILVGNESERKRGLTGSTVSVYKMVEQCFSQHKWYCFALLWQCATRRIVCKVLTMCDIFNGFRHSW